MHAAPGLNVYGHIDNAFHLRCARDGSAGKYRCSTFGRLSIDIELYVATYPRTRQIQGGGVDISVGSFDVKRSTCIPSIDEEQSVVVYYSPGVSGPG